jgi:hypothetical protein
MHAPVIRISLARFDARLGDQVEAALLASRARLDPAVRALNGNLGFFAGIDRANNAMHNVSLWETVADAEQLTHFEPMRQLATEFIALGVRFERPVLNFTTLWQFD